MRGSSFRYLSKQGLHNLAANRLMTLASVGVLTACLILVGIAGLFSANVDSLVEYLGDQNETVVYADRSLDEQGTADLDAAIRAVPGLSAVTYVSKEEVLETYKGYMEEYAVLFDDFEEDNPFSANYRVVVEDLTQLESIIAQLEAIEGVDDVSAPTELSNVFLSIQKAVNIGGWVLVAVLGLVSVVVISNTIRITVFARRKEISIMKYVGATNAFIRWPFFVEGMGAGLIAALVASGVVIGGYAVVLHYAGDLGNFFTDLLGVSLLPLSEVWYVILAVFVAFGMIIGSLGTATTIRKYLEV